MHLTEGEIAFPVLDPAQLDVLRTRGRSRAVAAGEVLFAEGDREFCFFVVLSGAVEILEHSSGRPHTVTIHQPGEFTGDIDMLSGRVALVTARVAVAGEVLELGAAALRAAVDELPEIGEILVRAFLARRVLLIDGGFEGLKIIGSRFSPDAHRLRDFATRNGVPFTWVDLETDPTAERLLREFSVAASATPVVIGRDGRFLSNPSLVEFARMAGLETDVHPKHDLIDLVVVGSGPAGLAAAVYAASEGLDVVVLERIGTGGQAGTSTRIENYLGFPAGISGAELTQNALLQAQKFGARITVPSRVTGFALEGGSYTITRDDGPALRARCVLIASGVEYRKLDVARLEEFEGAGVYYAATEMEARMCRNEDVVVVGAGNSAGQAITYLSRHARTVHLVLRGHDLGKSMSRYLVERVEHIENVRIHRGAVVSGLIGERRLAAVDIKSDAGGETRITTSALFLFIGADPNTAWLNACVELDRKGFVLTGPALPPQVGTRDSWRAAGRTPFLLETSVPGVFAAGDVRSGSVKRCASAVGEGAMAVSFVHAYLGAST